MTALLPMHERGGSYLIASPSRPGKKRTITWRNVLLTTNAPRQPCVCEQSLPFPSHCCNIRFYSAARLQVEVPRLFHGRDFLLLFINLSSFLMPLNSSLCSPLMSSSSRKRSLCSPLNCSSSWSCHGWKHEVYCKPLADSHIAESDVPRTRRH